MTTLNPNGITAGDTVPLVATLLDANDQPINLTGVIGVQFRMSRATPGVGHALIAAACVVLQTGVSPIVNKGKVQYNWGAGETALAAVYRLQWRITFGDGVVKSVPNTGFVSFEIMPLAA